MLRRDTKRKKLVHSKSKRNREGEKQTGGESTRERDRYLKCVGDLMNGERAANLLWIQMMSGGAVE